MRTEEKKALVSEKLKRKEFPLTTDEENLIKSERELTRELTVLLATDASVWTDYTVRLVSSEMIEFLVGEVSIGFWTNYVKYNIDNHLIFSSFEMDTIDNYGDFTPEARNNIDNLIEEYIRNVPAELANISCNDTTARLLMDYNRYDLFAEMSNERSRISEDIIIEVIDNFPFGECETPYFFGKYLDKLVDKLDKLSYKTIACYFSERNSYSASESLRNIDISFQVLIDKIKEIKLDPPEYIYELNSLSYMSTNPKSHEYIRTLYDAGMLNSLENGLYYKIITEDEAANLLLSYLTNTKDINFPFSNNSQVVQLLLKREELVDALIKNGFLITVMDIKLLNTWKEKESLCHEYINEFKKRSTDKLNLTLEMYQNEDLILEMIKAANIKTVELTSHYTSYEIDYKSIIKKIVDYNPQIRIENLYLVENTNNQEELALYLIEKNSIINFMSLMGNGYWSESSSKFVDFFNNNKELLSNCFLNIEGFARGILGKFDNLIIKNKELIKEFFQTEYHGKMFLDYISHHEYLHTFYNDENFELIKDFIVSSHNIEEQRLIELKELVGPIIIRILNNENIQELLRTDEKTFRKIVELFPETQFTMDDLEGAYDSLKQYGYAKTHSKVISIFPNILHAIEDKNEKVINESIESIYPYLNERFFSKLEEKYTLPEGYDKSNPKMFVAFVIAKIKNSEGDKKEKYINILHEITNYYINEKRCEYRDTYDMKRDLNLPFEYNPKSIEREKIKYYLHYCFEVKINGINENGESPYQYFTLSDCLTKKLLTYGLDKNTINETLNYHSNLKQYKRYTIDEEILKTNYKYLIRAMNELKKKNPSLSFSYEINIEELNNLFPLKKEYKVGQSGIDMSNVITTINLKTLKEGILENEEAYNILKTLMAKRKLHLIPICLTNILNKNGINISDDLNNIASFISYFSAIYEKEKSRLEANGISTENMNMNFTNILINAEAYSSISSVFSQILGDEDCRLIKANEGPNSASTKIANNERLKEAVRLTELLFKRRSVTIPTFNEVIDINDNKKMRVIVGNFTAPSNLTHGERTGACMRIGGDGETLFNFALKNENGFHIRFENPETGKYVSRVTGFRNGNTVFLNELRNSYDKDNYDDENVIDACRRVGQMLIELSKDSSCPIENVVVHRAYATSRMEKSNVVLNVRNIKQGLPPFYSDVNNNPIILATTAKDKAFTPVDLSKERVPKYLPAREKPYISQDIQKLASRINRVHAVKRMLAGENYEYLAALDFPSGLIYAIVNDDWYIYIDRDGNIHQEIIDIDSRAKEEMAEYLIKLETEINIEDLREASYGL